MLSIEKHILHALAIHGIDNVEAPLVLLDFVAKTYIYNIPVKEEFLRYFQSSADTFPPAEQDQTVEEDYYLQRLQVAVEGEIKRRFQAKHTY